MLVKIIMIIKIIYIVPFPMAMSSMALLLIVYILLKDVVATFCSVYQNNMQFRYTFFVIHVIEGCVE